MVFSADLYVLRPLDGRASNGTVLFEVVNRGNKRMFPTFNTSEPAAGPQGPGQRGDYLWLLSEKCN